VPTIVECLGGPRDGETRPFAMYGRSWPVWGGLYTIGAWRGLIVYRWERA
jgi:hypothetical protein